MAFDLIAPFYGKQNIKINTMNIKCLNIGLIDLCLLSHLILSFVPCLCLLSQWCVSFVPPDMSFVTLLVNRIRKECIRKINLRKSLIKSAAYGGQIEKSFTVKPSRLLPQIYRKETV